MTSVNNETGEFSSRSEGITHKLGQLKVDVLEPLGSETGLESGDSDVVALKGLTTAECEAISTNYPGTLMWNKDRGELWSIWSPQAAGTQAVRARQIHPYKAFCTGGTLSSGPTMGSAINLTLHASADSTDVYRNFISYTGASLNAPVLTTGVWYVQLSANWSVSSADAGDWLDTSVVTATGQTWAGGAYTLKNRLVLPLVSSATTFLQTVSGFIIVDTQTALNAIVDRGGDTNPTVGLTPLGGTLPDQNTIYFVAVKVGGLSATDEYTPS